jgi:hypothetical protein
MAAGIALGSILTAGSWAAVGFHSELVAANTAIAQYVTYPFTCLNLRSLR